MSLSPGTRLGPCEIAAHIGQGDFDVTPDGRRFLRIFPAEPAATGEPVRPTINIVVQNWHEELRQRVPTP
jgi:hypothetical protein